MCMLTLMLCYVPFGICIFSQFDMLLSVVPTHINIHTWMWGMQQLIDRHFSL